MGTIRVVIISLIIVLGLQCAKRVSIPEQGVSSTQEIYSTDITKAANEYAAKLQTTRAKYEFPVGVIFPGDEIDIIVYEKLPVSDEKKVLKKRVDPDGAILLPPAGKIQVAGLSVYEAARTIEAILSKYVVSPFCEIAVTRSERRIFVFGQIPKPGVQELKPGYTILDALSSAGGISENTASWSIKVIRSENGKISIISVKDIFTKGRISQNIMLENNDIVFVPRRILTDAMEILRELSAILPWWFFAVSLQK